MLPIALRYIVIQKGLAAARAAQARVDEQAVSAQLQRIRTALRTIKEINSKATGIRGLADGVSTDAELLRGEIGSALIACEEALRTPLDSGEATQRWRLRRLTWPHAPRSCSAIRPKRRRLGKTPPTWLAWPAVASEADAPRPTPSTAFNRRALWSPGATERGLTSAARRPA